jgi:metal-responsive CopG/Arc/MetJ family transcriptional regulator
MTITVRLPEPLEQALEQYSSSNGVSKSHVVQEALALYMVQAQGHGAPSKAGPVSSNYSALKKAGLLGAVRGMHGESATKEVVRKKVLASRKVR